MAFRLLDASYRAHLSPGVEDFAGDHLPRQLLGTNPNIGKDLFLSLRCDLL